MASRFVSRAVTSTRIASRMSPSGHGAMRGAFWPMELRRGMATCECEVVDSKHWNASSPSLPNPYHELTPTHLEKHTTHRKHTPQPKIICEPSAKRFTPEHEYVIYDSDSKIGVVSITDYAQKALGDVVFVELPSVGTHVHKGGPQAISLYIPPHAPTSLHPSLPPSRYGNEIHAD